MIIAIDGPAASGKGTLAKRLAQECNLIHLDTGKLYRFITWHLQQNDNCDVASQDFEKNVRLAVEALTLDALSDKALLAEQVGQMASQISAQAFVRQQLMPLQRSLAKNIPQDKNGLVLDGRDIGTVIFPDADYKFFLDASIDKRAERRYQEMQAKNISLDETSLEGVKQMIMTRDEADSQRALAPLKPADDAIHLDSSDLTIDLMVMQARNHMNKA